ncbi:hypothetical protein Thivi_3886 [Thiocystis violascens DSM 198]|uniref:Uncharacterized protein n=1 Tax=Thiocystis violascens (strain ATCC 17096 / DSM 198 / 6111) TaxID=765911 RepID=I3YFF8_THIV6|nr:hypothetical protein Thivi_3886 [Thiocystis violascens DSM 198]
MKCRGNPIRAFRGQHMQRTSLARAHHRGEGTSLSPTFSQVWNYFIVVKHCQEGPHMITARLRRSGGSLIVAIPPAYIEQN